MENTANTTRVRRTTRFAYYYPPRPKAAARAHRMPFWLGELIESLLFWPVLYVFFRLLMCLLCD